MKPLIASLLLLTPSLLVAQDGAWKSLFDGKTLDGWNGNPKFWSVQDGLLTGQTTAENPTNGNTFIIWEGGEVGDFELKLEYKIVNGNSGIQYRSVKLENGADEWRIGGYQGDFEAGDTYSGILYGEQFRGILAQRGKKTVIDPGGKPRDVATLGDSAEIQKQIKKEDWNTYEISAKGFHFVHKINGVVTAECTDEDTDARRAMGILALQLHAGPPMTVQFRNIQLKVLGGEKKGQAQAAPATPPAQRAQPSDSAETVILQVREDGSYVIRTGPLTETGLKQALGGLAEMNSSQVLQIQGGKNVDRAKLREAKTLVEAAGLTVKMPGNRNR